MDKCSKLPDIIRFDDYDGQWELYEEELYKVFKNAFIESEKKFIGKSIGIFTNKMYNDKEKTFWHVISEGPNEFERIPDIRRCERICWIDKMISTSICHGCDEIYMWKHKHKNKKYRYKLWCRKTDFIVILEERGDKFMLITAYIVKYNHTKIKLEKEYDKSTKI
ncbi:hypothetical protein [Clostridium sporogenes]|uniref:hypothetical protein n=1 Tax=Clostridium sporogenes TaxID=1509 RepID=UPI00024BA9B9|nr:hypothetical protein [Clostridium sporogenes]EHN13258.1 hypothetical protein IYC_20545 [Clostridium sporogenes PA 3679]MBA4509755.1 hypothetical protein [Clostridium sporogenes]MDU4599811.1 hypothetical protein [Clostridium sporogenes]NFQ36947.1 hypothetical protein [Clostridium sporogenes]NFQ59288.1 hypothetical protein [Clostridium sporogenes]